MKKNFLIIAAIAIGSIASDNVYAQTNSSSTNTQGNMGTGTQSATGTKHKDKGSMKNGTQGASGTSGTTGARKQKDPTIKGGEPSGGWNNGGNGKGSNNSDHGYDNGTRGATGTKQRSNSTDTTMRTPR